ncbi:MAG: ATP-dependent 6-phosphofructokinase [Elusimicrobia bacterium]|nr:ATP-dependent 6-phosphofructokinase [Elusimicrobiota bacterium]
MPTNRNRPGRANIPFLAPRLQKCRFSSPLSGVHFISDDAQVVLPSQLDEIKSFIAAGEALPCFEKAGPRRKIAFDPARLRCGIVTCGGICPGLNDVIRATVLSLFNNYGVRTMYGFRYGFEGLCSRYRHAPVRLTPELVADIYQKGGTILGSSRGPQKASEMVDTLERLRVGILFVVGGDGTLRGAQSIAEEVGRRGLKIAVVGIPKTIDNDIRYVQESFGFETAVTETRAAISAAHAEAASARNGIGLVKLMGRHSGFIAAFASLSNSVVNFCLVPEVSFRLEAFLKALQERLARSGHAVIVTAEGAGQDLLEEAHGRDASGNARLGDIGLFLRDAITRHFEKEGRPVNLKYIDPSYTIRSAPANARDSAFCLLLSHNAVHAGMAGRTNMVVGFWKNEFTHVPIALAVSERQRLLPQEGPIWSSVLAATGQPREMR